MLDAVLLFDRDPDSEPIWDPAPNPGPAGIISYLRGKPGPSTRDKKNKVADPDLLFYRDPDPGPIWDLKPIPIRGESIQTKARVPEFFQKDPATGSATGSKPDPDLLAGSRLR